MNKNRNEYYIRVLQNGEMIHSTRTRKLRRFSRLVQAEQFLEDGINVYIRVRSSKEEDVFDKLSIVENEGWYDSKKDLMLAYKAFLEASR